MLLNTPVCDFGWPAPTFDLPDLAGEPHSVLQHSVQSAMGPKGLVVVFICNHCPYVKAIIGRLVKDAAVLQAEGFGVVGIMPNDYHVVPADSPERMREFSKAHGMTFPYLLDEDQSVARAYGAVATPDFFGFDAEAKLQYRGRLDDAKMGDASNRTPELLNAMRLVAETGEGPKDQTPSVGCSIKWK